ncbi:MAG: hypothetical protein ABH868_00220 [bacterium]
MKERLFNYRNTLLFLIVLKITFLLFRVSSIEAREIELNGQVSGWLAYSDQWKIGTRYIPCLSILDPVPTKGAIDAEVSVNAYTWTSLDLMDEIDDNTRAKFYRLWVRYYGEQGELRLGLQKVNFGPAQVLRSLMWFDQIDERDPLELTDGVKGLLFRYYFLNNANIWLWGLYGNNDLKGLETYETDNKNPEVGGRLQVSLGKGDVAFSYHRRDVDVNIVLDESTGWRSNRRRKENLSGRVIKDGFEDRFAFDGKWDIGIGAWFEASVGKFSMDAEGSIWQEWEEFLTLGTDYTMDIGPGVHVLYEHFVSSSGPELYEQDNNSNISAASVDFSVSVLDSINAIGYYDWKQKELYSFVSWQRTYDDWLITMSVFSSSETDTSAYSGDGALLMVTYNH